MQVHPLKSADPSDVYTVLRTLYRDDDAIRILKLIGSVAVDPSDPDVVTMSRSGRPIELCQGPLLFTLVMVYCGLYQFRTDL